MDRIRRRGCILCGVGVGGLLPERIKAVVEMTYQRTLDQIIADLGTFSPTTVAMLVNVVLDYTDDDHSNWCSIANIKVVMAGLPTEMGAEFDARVHEALSYTREDGGSIFDCDKEM